VKPVSAEFVRSAAQAADFPTDRMPEVAMVGRSNVGKSSLINALVRQRIARTSSTPGRTRVVNFYRVRPAPGRPFYLVDLPGFGYATGGAAGRAEFARITAAYFDDPAGGPIREVVAGLVLVVDGRHPGLASDREALDWIASRGVPFAVAAAKTDKLSRAERARALGNLERIFAVPALATSATTGEGMAELWKRLLIWTSHP